MTLEFGTKVLNFGRETGLTTIVVQDYRVVTAVGPGFPPISPTIARNPQRGSTHGSKIRTPQNPGEEPRISDKRMFPNRRASCIYPELVEGSQGIIQTWDNS